MGQQLAGFSSARVTQNFPIPHTMLSAQIWLADREFQASLALSFFMVVKGWLIVLNHQLPPKPHAHHARALPRPQALSAACAWSNPSKNAATANSSPTLFRLRVSANVAGVSSHWGEVLRW